MPLPFREPETKAKVKSPAAIWTVSVHQLERGAMWHSCLLCEQSFKCTPEQWNRHKKWCVWDHLINRK